MGTRVCQNTKHATNYLGFIRPCPGPGLQPLHQSARQGRAWSAHAQYRFPWINAGIMGEGCSKLSFEFTVKISSGSGPSGQSFSYGCLCFGSPCKSSFTHVAVSFVFHVLSSPYVCVLTSRRLLSILQLEEQFVSGGHNEFRKRFVSVSVRFCYTISHEVPESFSHSVSVSRSRSSSLCRGFSNATL